MCDLKLSPQVGVVCTTSSDPGAIAIVQLVGHGVRQVLRRVTGVADWPRSKMRLIDVADVDQGLVVLLSDRWAQISCHGGPRVVQQLVRALMNAGAVPVEEPSAGDLYPEAQSDLEADMLATLSRAASPRAVDLLLAQPMLWRRWLTTQQPPPTEVLKRSNILNRCVDPPSVVVVGGPNVGKSTLTNRMLRRSASVVADLPGTTRDWVSGVAQLEDVAVRWMDTPGLRTTDDPVERIAHDLARRAIEMADVLIAVRDSSTDFPGHQMTRTPDLWVMNKIDLAHNTDNPRDIAISALLGQGIDHLQSRILTVLGLTRSDPVPWAFSGLLRRILINCEDSRTLEAYVSERE